MCITGSQLTYLRLYCSARTFKLVFEKVRWVNYLSHSVPAKILISGSWPPWVVILDVRFYDLETYTILHFRRDDG